MSSQQVRTAPSDELLVEAALYANKALGLMAYDDDVDKALQAYSGLWRGNIWYECVRAYLAGAAR